VASICPWNLNNTADADYGYRPAIAALIDRLKTQLRGRCLPRVLQPNCGPDIPKSDPTYGQVPCVILEAMPPDASGQCNCGARPPGRKNPNPQTSTSEVTDGHSCVCEIQQLSGADQQACEKVDSGSANGWCYVDPGQGLGDPALVQQCHSTEQRL